MAELSVIPKRMPKKFDDVDTDHWAAEALCMLQNADWHVRPHYLVGLDEADMWQSVMAFNFVMKSHGVPMILPKRNAIRQRMSRSSMLQEDIAIMSGYHPDSFFDLMEGAFAVPMADSIDAISDLMEGAFAVPMADSIDAISDAYDSGHAIYVVQLQFKG